MNWISVKNRLPQCNYLLVGGLDDEGRWINSIARYCGDEWSMLEDGQGFYSDIGGWPLSKEQITHWCEIPDNPTLDEFGHIFACGRKFEGTYPNIKFLDIWVCSEYCPKKVKDD